MSEQHAHALPFRLETMQTASRHVPASELKQGLAHVLASPSDEGRLEAIVIRPQPNERRTLTAASLTPKRGVDGDRWYEDPHLRLEDGSPDPRNQVSLMNARILRQVAGDEDALCLAGDNLIVDLDLSDDNLPTGSRLAIGGVVLEITDLPHTGCTKFSRRYGREAREFINTPRGKELHLRGRYARVITPGTIHVGDAVRKLPAA
jgi:hypothetical protein